MIGIPVYRDTGEAIERLGAQSPMFRGMLEERRWLRASHYVRFLYRWSWLAPRFDLPVDVYLDAMQHTWNSLEGTLRETILGTDYGALMAAAGRTPLLFIHGEADAVAPIAAARALAAKGSDVQFVALPRADHQLLLREPETVWSVVRTFEQQASAR